MKQILAQIKKPGFFYVYDDEFIYVYTKRRRLYKVYDRTLSKEFTDIAMAIIGVRYA